MTKLFDKKEIRVTQVEPIVKGAWLKGNLSREEAKKLLYNKGSISKPRVKDLVGKLREVRDQKDRGQLKGGKRVETLDLDGEREFVEKKNRICKTVTGDQAIKKVKEKLAECEKSVDCAKLNIIVGRGQGRTVHRALIYEYVRQKYGEAAFFHPENDGVIIVRLKHDTSTQESREKGGGKIR